MRTRLSALLICLLFASVAYPHDGERPTVIPGPGDLPRGEIDTPRRPGDPTSDFPEPNRPGTGPIEGPLPGTPVPRPRQPDRPGIPKRGGKPRPASETNSPEHWSTWWMLNRERFVDLRSRRETRGRALRSGSTPHFFGEGSPRNVRPEPRQKALAAALTAIEKACLDPDQHVATSAIIALGKSGQIRAVPLLIRIGNDSGRRREEREAALLALGMLGLRVDEVRDALVVALGEEERTVGERASAALGLGLLGDSAAVPVLMRRAFSAERQRDVPAASILAASLAGGEFVVPDFSRAVSGKPTARPNDPRIRAMMAAGLGKSGVREAMPALRRALGDREMEVRRQAVLSLGALAGADDAEIVADLVRLLAYERDSTLKGYAALALGEIGSVAGADSILYLYRKGSSVEVQYAALALGLLVHEAESADVREKIVPVIRAEFVKRRSSSLRGALAIGLGLARDTEAVPALIDAYQDSSDVWLRGMCATALGMIGDVRARVPLRRGIEERGDHRVTWDAAFALGMMADEEAARILIAKLKTEKSEYTRGAAALALGFLVPPEKAAVLVEILGNPKNSDATRTLAAIALGRVVEKAKVPILSRLSDHLDPGLPEGAVRKVLRIM